MLVWGDVKSGRIWDMGVQIHVFLNLNIKLGEWSASRSGARSPVDMRQVESIGRLDVSV
jgi:hypothetical protein